MELLDDKLIPILESLYDGVLIADKLGIVKYVNDSYLRITKTTRNEILNTYVEETRPGSKLAEVIRTGKTIRHLPRKVGKLEYYANLVPIIDNNEIIGGVSISSEIQDIQSLFEQLKLSQLKVNELQKEINKFYNTRYTFDDILGDSLAIKKVKADAKKYSKSEFPVLIMGDSGTGKELFAQSIHNSSRRSNYPFVAINCATLSSELLESELFGYSPGSFTGANKKGKLGLFQAAESGTLFLDEIGELDIKLQAKILRTLQEKTIRPLGSTKEIPVDVRIICATNRNLTTMVEMGHFRADLYYRLSVFELVLPSLEKRKVDIDIFIENFGANVFFPPEIKTIFKNYSWPGNIRELKNTIQFCVEISEGCRVKIDDLPTRMLKRLDHSEINTTDTLSSYISKKENDYIKSMLDIYGYDIKGKKKVAELLDISLATLYNKLNKN